MRKKCVILFLSFLLFYSCKENQYKNISDWIKQNLGADQLDISESKDSIFIDIHYNTPPQMGYDFKSSSAAMQFADTAKLLTSNTLKVIKVNIHSNQEITRYSYPLSDLKANQLAMNDIAAFLQNLLSSKNEQNARYVDLDKISLEDLLNLNTINDQMQSNVQIKKISIDGFTTNHSEPQNIEFRGQLQGDSEGFPFVFQYDKIKGKIFYFGINE